MVRRDESSERFPLLLLNNSASDPNTKKKPVCTRKRVEDKERRIVFTQSSYTFDKDFTFFLINALRTVANWHIVVPSHQKLFCIVEFRRRPCESNHRDFPLYSIKRS